MVKIDQEKNLNLKNKNIVITGGSGGLGKALALEFLKKTPNVLISDINRHMYFTPSLKLWTS